MNPDPCLTNGTMAIARALAITSIIWTVMVSGYLVNYGLNDAPNDRIYFLIAPSIPLCFAILGTLGVFWRNGLGQALSWVGACLLTLFFIAPGLVGVLYLPAGLLMLTASTFKTRALAR